MWSKAAVLHSIVKNHPLVDGNKRLGWLAFAVFLDINGIDATSATNDDVSPVATTESCTSTALILHACRACSRRPGLMAFADRSTTPVAVSDRALDGGCTRCGQLLCMPYQWHSYAMARERISTTVDGGLLAEARAVRAGLNDAALFDAALAALVRSSRAVEIDAAYAAYDDHPMDEPDEWGDLASFRDAAAAS